MGVLQRAQENGAIEKTYEDVDTEPRRIYLRPAITVPDVVRKRNKDGYWELNGQMEHRVVWEQAFGQIPFAWVVHHINFVRDDNRIDNLVALPNRVHQRIHTEMRDGRAQYTQAELWPLYHHLKAEQERLDAELTRARSIYKKLCKEFKGLGFDTPRILTPSASDKKRFIKDRGRKWDAAKKHHKKGKKK